MRTATATPPAPVRRGPLRRLAEQRRTTPGRLRVALTGLVALALLTGLVAGLAGGYARAGTADLGDRAQPLLLEAETVASALADADTTAAQAFLSGGLEPAGLTARYEQDLDRAAAALASAARRTDAGGEAGQAIATLATGLPRYASLVAGARANNRQGLPVGASYLATASALNRDTLQPAAQVLLRSAQREVSAGYSAARTTALTLLLAALVVATLGALAAVQIRESRRTRRTLSVPLLGATGAILLLGVAALVILGAQRVHLAAADSDGSRPVAALASARILALRERGDEALTLVARSGSGEHEDDFTASGRQLGTLLRDAGDLVARTPAAREVVDAVNAHDRYQEQHAKVRELDDGGDYDGAVEQALGAGSGDSFAELTDAIGAALDDREAAFAGEIDDARTGLGLLAVLGPLLALAACWLAVAGLRTRLEEYK